MHSRLSQKSIALLVLVAIVIFAAGAAGGFLYQKYHVSLGKVGTSSSATIIESPVVNSVMLYGLVQSISLTDATMVLFNKGETLSVGLSGVTRVYTVNVASKTQGQQLGALTDIQTGQVVEVGTRFADNQLQATSVIVISATKK